MYWIEKHTGVRLNVVIMIMMKLECLDPFFLPSSGIRCLLMSIILPLSAVHIQNVHCPQIEALIIEGYARHVQEAVAALKKHAWR